jgi:hypothetical protein
MCRPGHNLVNPPAVLPLLEVANIVPKDCGGTTKPVSHLLHRSRQFDREDAGCLRFRTKECGTESPALTGPHHVRIAARLRRKGVNAPPDVARIRSRGSKRGITLAASVWSRNVPHTARGSRRRGAKNRAPCAFDRSSRRRAQYLSTSVPAPPTSSGAQRGSEQSSHRAWVPSRRTGQICARIVGHSARRSLPPLECQMHPDQEKPGLLSKQPR